MQDRRNSPCQSYRGHFDNSHVSSFMNVSICYMTSNFSQVLDGCISIPNRKTCLTYAREIELPWVENKLPRTRLIPFLNSDIFKSVYVSIFNILSKTMVLVLWSNGIVLRVLDSEFRGPRFKITGWFQGRLSLSSF